MDHLKGKDSKVCVLGLVRNLYMNGRDILDAEVKGLAPAWGLFTVVVFDSPTPERL